MNFEKPIKTEIDNIKCFIGALTTAIEIDDISSLLVIEDTIVDHVVNKSKEWFGKELGIERVRQMYTPCVYEDGMCIKGLVFYTNKFKLDTFVRSSFFEEIEEAGTETETETGHISQESTEQSEHTNQPEQPEQIEQKDVLHVENEELEQVQVHEQVEEQEQEQEHEHVQVQEQVQEQEQEQEQEVRNESSGEKRMHYLTQRQLKEKIKEAADAGDWDKAYKISKILSQLRL